MLEKCQGEAERLIESAEVKFGRENSLFDQTSKLLILVQKTANSAEFMYLLKGLYVLMLWAETADCAKKDDLTSRSGALQCWLFCRRLTSYMRKKYIFRAENDELTKAIDKTWAILQCPLEWHEASNSSLQFMSGLPVPLQKIWDIISKTMSGRHNSALKGMLAMTQGPLQPQDFLACKEVKPSLDDLETAYKKYTGDSSLAEGHDPGQAEKVSPNPAKSASASEDSLKQLEKDATNQAVELLQKRLVFWLHCSIPGPCLNYSTLSDSHHSMSIYLLTNMLTLSGI